MVNQFQFDMNRLTPYAVGFDKVFDRVVNYLEHQTQSTGFPPYDIRTEAENKFSIVIALAGYDEKDLEIEVKEGVIAVRSKHDTVSDEKNYLYHGISNKKFTRTFTIADDIEVLGATMKNGLLAIMMQRIVPDHKKSKVIVINGEQEQDLKPEILSD
jgi:molecular chaperone IbpA